MIVRKRQKNSISLKKFFSSNCSYRHLECSFDISTGASARNCQTVSALGLELIRRNFFLEELVSKSCEHVESRFDKPLQHRRKIVWKNQEIATQSSKMIKNIFFPKWMLASKGSYGLVQSISTTSLKFFRQTAEIFVVPFPKSIKRLTFTKYIIPINILLWTR